MGLKLGNRHQKGGSGGGGGVSRRWVFFFCISSFCFGVLLINRLWDVSDPGKLDEDNSSVKTSQKSELLPSINCEKKGTSIHAGEILDQVSQTHSVIMTLEKTVSSLEMQLATARAAKASNQGVSSTVTKPSTKQYKDRQKVFFVMGIMTAFSSRMRRDSIRQTWMPQGEELRMLEKQKGIVMRFVIGHSATQGGLLDRAINAEEEQHRDFLRLNHVEGYHELSSKTQIYFSTAVAQWDADFYIKADDDVHVNPGMLGSTLARHKSKPRVYMGCMKSGPVVTQKSVKYHEPEYWKFGVEGNKYFRHATGQLYVISKDLATYISVNRHILHRYANEDVSLGSWFIGLDVQHIDDHNLCCGTPPDPMPVIYRIFANSMSGILKDQVMVLCERGDNSSSGSYVKEYYDTPIIIITLEDLYDCEQKTQAGSPCAASFDWSCSGICKSVERMEDVHQRCGEGNGTVWQAKF